ncbi:MAG: hypothetical protein AAGK78_07980, partial [Planctomycetota bacterium]
VAGALLLVGGIYFATQITVAEVTATQARKSVEQNDIRGGLAGLLRATDYTPVRNARWLVQAAELTPDAPTRLKLVDRALELEPRNIRPLLLRAATLGETDTDVAIASLQQAVAWNPNDRALRERLAELLDITGSDLAAADQYEMALELNDKLHPDEMERYDPAKIEILRTTVRTLRGHDD